MNAPADVVGNGIGHEYLFRLYVTGNSPRSTLAIQNATRLLKEFLPEKFDLEIIDIYRDPDAAVGAQIIAIPTLVKIRPGTTRRVIGDLSDADKVISALMLITSAID